MASVFIMVGRQRAKYGPPSPSMVTAAPLGAHCLAGCPTLAYAPALRDGYRVEFES